MKRSPFFRRLITTAGALACTAAAAATPEPITALGSEDRNELLDCAHKTWKCVAAMGQRGELPADGLHLINGVWCPFPFTTPTDVASYIWSTLAAERLHLIATAEAQERVERMLTKLERLERAHGFFCDRLDPVTGGVLRKTSVDGKPTSAIASSVDNGWLALSLILVRNSFIELRKRADAILEPMNFGFFYVPYNLADPVNRPGQMRSPYFIDQRRFGGLERIINSEQRISIYIAIARGQVPPETYFHINRTLSAEGMKQSQRPQGEMHTYNGVSVFEGHYTYRGMQIVPSWGGSMFEALMVTLFVPEERWGPKSWGVNHPLYVRGQIEHGLKQAGYGFWGFSPSCDPEGGYRTYGVDALGADPVGYCSNNDDIHTKPGVSAHKGQYKNGVVTPHASFLALRFAPREAMDNLRKLKAAFPIYGEYGFMDSVNVSNGTVADRVLILDQGMILVAIANALADDAMRAAFIDEHTEKLLRPLMAVEEFTAGPAPAETTAPDSGRLP